MVLVAVNAWSEVSAMTSAAVVSLYLQLVLAWDSDRPLVCVHMLVTVGGNHGRLAGGDDAERTGGSGGAV